MAAGVMQADTRRKLDLAAIHLDATLEVQPHHADHVLDLEAVAEFRVAHVRPGDEAHLALLQMKARDREFVEIADMVVMQMRQHHVGDRLRRDAELGQRVHRAAQELALALGRDLLGEAGVDHHDTALAADHPGEIIHRHRRVVRVAADEMVGAPGLARGVADGENFVLGHCPSPISRPRPGSRAPRPRLRCRKSACRAPAWRDSDRAHAAIREFAAEILGIGERAVGRDPRLHRQALDGLGIAVPGQRHFRGRGMAALADRIELAAQRLDARAVPPVAQRALDRGLVAHALHRAFGIDLGEGRRHGGDVAAMAVDEEKAREAVSCQRNHRIAYHGHQGARPHGDRPREAQVMLRHADRDGRRHQRAYFLADAAADHLRGQRVGADQAGRTMLLGRADRDDDAGLGLEIVVDEFPRLELQLHEARLL